MAADGRSALAERKWLVHGADATWLEDHSPPERLVDINVVVEGETNLRVHQRDDAYTLTVKGKPDPRFLGAADIARTEVEFPITEAQFMALTAISVRPRVIRKTRQVIFLGDGLSAELDVLDGMCMAGVEFPSLAAAEEFCPPVWFGPEVTDDPAFGSSELALHLGTPEFSAHIEHVWEGFTPYMIARRARDVLRRRLPLEPSENVKYVTCRNGRGQLEHYREGGYVAFVGDREVLLIQSRLDFHKHPEVAETFEVLAGRAHVSTATGSIEPWTVSTSIVPSMAFTAEANQWHGLHVCEHATPWDPYFYGAYVLRGVPKAKATVYAPRTRPHVTTLFSLDG